MSEPPEELPKICVNCPILTCHRGSSTCQLRLRRYAYLAVKSRQMYLAEVRHLSCLRKHTPLPKKGKGREAGTQGYGPDRTSDRRAAEKRGLQCRSHSFGGIAGRCLSCSRRSSHPWRQRVPGGLRRQPRPFRRRAIITPLRTVAATASLVRGRSESRIFGRRRRRAKPCAFWMGRIRGERT